MSLLEPEFLRGLERLAVAARRAAAGPFTGEHASARPGRSVEFSDYRDYSPGDDFRHIDWNAYGRLDRLFLKLFRDEAEYSIHLLLDVSASMGWRPEKFQYARQAAASIAYVSLCNFDRVTLSAVDHDVRDRFGPLRGRGSAMAAFEFLERLPARGASDLLRAMRAFAGRRERRGVAVVISDFLQEEGAVGALRLLRGARHEVFALQVLTPEELDPTLLGDLRLVDAETAAEREVTVTPDLLRAYREVVERYVGGLRADCLRSDIGHTLAVTSRPLSDLLFGMLRRERLLG